jgi:hypothetical protein
MGLKLVTHTEGLQTEVNRIAESSLLTRCPQQKALLLYLLACTVRQQTPSQFDIATNALGRSCNFDEAADSSVRTHVSRLRKTLSAYYATHQPEAGLCVFIRSGEYRIRLGALPAAYPDLVTQGCTTSVLSLPASPPATSTALEADFATAFQNIVPRSNAQPHTAIPWPKTRRWLIVTCVSLIAPLSLVVSGNWRSPAGAEAVAPLRVPSVAFSADVDVAEDVSPPLQSLASSARSELRKSLISRFEASPSDGADFVVTLSAGSIFGGEKGNLTLSDADGIALAEHSFAFSGDPRRDREAVRSVLREIVSPAGPIARTLVARSGDEPRNGFECFLHVENHRAFGADARALLERCVARTRDSEYWPYLQARAIFYRVQQRQAANEDVGERSKEWQAIASLLSAEPQNPYVATLAAKVLIGRGKCEAARGFVVTSLSRGRTYSAMELSLLVDAIGCGFPANDFELGENRFDEIASLHGNQTPLGDIYLVLGNLALGRRSDALAILKEPFSHSGETHTALLRTAIVSLLQCHAYASSIAIVEAELPKFVFNRQTRNLITRVLQSNPSMPEETGQACPRSRAS